MTTWTVVGRGMAPVAVAASRKQARRFSDQYDAAMAGRASGKTLAKVVARVQEAHGVTGVVKARRPKPGPRCGSCGRFNKLAGAHFCTKCGFRLSGKVGAAAKAGRPRCSGCGLLNAAGAEDCARCDYSLPSGADDDRAPDKSYTCAGCKAKVHSDRETCPFCGRIAGVAKSAVPAGVGVVEGLAGVVRKATQSTDSDERAAAIGRLMQAVGREVTTRIVAGDLVSPQQFTRAYLSQHRAPLSAPAGSSPRVPQARAISSDDFRRPALSAGHQRPSPLSPLQALEQAGQMGIYPPGAGVAAGDRYAASPTSTTLAPGLARANAARGAFSNPPMPGDARPW